AWSATRCAATRPRSASRQVPISSRSSATRASPTRRSTTPPARGRAGSSLATPDEPRGRQISSLGRSHYHPMKSLASRDIEILRDESTFEFKCTAASDGGSYLPDFRGGERHFDQFFGWPWRLWVCGRRRAFPCFPSSRGKRRRSATPDRRHNPPALFAAAGDTEALVLALRIVEIKPGANTGFGLGHTRIGVEVGE